MDRLIRRPCPTCPWRVDQDASVIPGFSLDLAEDLARTCVHELGAPMFACHQSRAGEEFPCAGWLAVYGYDSIAARLMVLSGHLPVEALDIGVDWPEPHDSFQAVIETLRRTWDAETPNSRSRPDPDVGANTSHAT